MHLFHLQQTGQECLLLDRKAVVHSLYFFKLIWKMISWNRTMSTELSNTSKDYVWIRELLEKMWNGDSGGNRGNGEWWEQSSWTTYKGLTIDSKCQRRNKSQSSCGAIKQNAVEHLELHGLALRRNRAGYRCEEGIVICWRLLNVWMWRKKMR